MLTLELLKFHHISNYAKNITVRFRCPGAKYKVKGRSGTHSLTKLFQEKGIPPWQRNYTPLIFQGGRVNRYRKYLAYPLNIVWQIVRKGIYCQTRMNSS